MILVKNISSPEVALAAIYSKDTEQDTERFDIEIENEEINTRYNHQSENSSLIYRSISNKAPETSKIQRSGLEINSESVNLRWRRIILLVIAITVHNIPGMSAYFSYKIC